MNHRTIFFVSDRTAITAETLGQSLITQFEDINFLSIRLPFIDSVEKAQQAAQRIEQAYVVDQQNPIVFGTLIQDDLREIVSKSTCLYIDFVQTFIGPLEKEFGSPSSHSIGKSHGIRNYQDYTTRIESVNFAIGYDDGINLNGYQKADVILVGVSRSGKTPTCLYLALQFGIRAANYPLTEEDLAHSRLPVELLPYRNKLIGLTIDPEQLAVIRHERRPNSPYASLARCQEEVKMAEKILIREKIPYLNSTNSSIEEMATRIMEQAHLDRRIQRT
ncbi:MAG: pyruvate, water dikinase regulatory protein [Pseudomonadota bacterium]